MFNKNIFFNLFISQYKKENINDKINIKSQISIIDFKKVGVFQLMKNIENNFLKFAKVITSINNIKPQQNEKRTS